MGLGDEPHQVAVARLVLGVEAEVIALFVLEDLGVAQEMVTRRRDVRLDAEDGLYRRQPRELLLRGLARVVEGL